MNNCNPKTKNTASSRCKFDWGLFARTVLTPRDKFFTGLDSNNQPITFDEWLLKGIHAKLKKDRFYPMPLFSDIANNSEESKPWTNGYGQKFVIMEGNKGMTQSYNQDYCLSNRLASFNDGMARRVLIFDNKNICWLVEKANGKQGYEASIFCTGAGINSPSDLVEPKIEYSFKHPSEFVNKIPMETELDITDLEGLEDIEMVVVVGETNTEITFRSGCGSYDVTSELAAIGGKKPCWTIDGVEVTTAPTYDDGKFTIINTALQTNKVLNIATPDILYANGVSFKECSVGVKIILP